MVILTFISNGKVSFLDVFSREDFMAVSRIKCWIILLKEWVRSDDYNVFSIVFRGLLSLKEYDALFVLFEAYYPCQDLTLTCTASFLIGNIEMYVNEKNINNRKWIRNPLLHDQPI